MPGVLEVQAEHEDQPVERDVDDDTDRRGDRERPDPEQAQRQHRPPPDRFDGHEPAQRDGGQTEAGQHERVGEAIVTGLDHRPGQRGQGHDGGQLAGYVQRAVGRPGGLGGEPHGEQDARQPDRGVDEEDGPPAQRRGEDAAEQRAPGQRDRRPGRPQPHGPCTRPRVIVGVIEQAQRARHQHRGAHPLDGPGGDQYPQQRGQPAGRRGQREQREPADEHPLGPDPVAERPGRQDQRRERQRVGPDHPLQPADPAPEVRADRLDGHVHDAHVKLDDAKAEAGGQQRPSRGAAGLVAGGCAESLRPEPIGRHTSTLAAR